MTSPWLVPTFVVVFSAMAVFYLARLTFLRNKVVSCCGFWSPWHETVHIFCGIAMVAMTTSAFSFIRPTLWAAMFLLFAFCYLARSPVRTRNLTALAWNTLHVGMLLGMAYMFLPLRNETLTILACLVYGAGAIFFGYWVLRGLSQTPRYPLALGSDLFHVLMSIGMVIMFIVPNEFLCHSASEMTK